MQTLMWRTHSFSLDCNFEFLFQFNAIFVDLHLHSDPVWKYHLRGYTSQTAFTFPLLQLWRILILHPPRKETIPLTFFFTLHLLQLLNLTFSLKTKQGEGTSTGQWHRPHRCWSGCCCCSRAWYWWCCHREPFPRVLPHLAYSPTLSPVCRLLLS